MTTKPDENKPVDKPTDETSKPNLGDLVAKLEGRIAALSEPKPENESEKLVSLLTKLTEKVELLEKRGLTAISKDGSLKTQKDSIPASDDEQKIRSDFLEATKKTLGLGRKK